MRPRLTLPTLPSDILKSFNNDTRPVSLIFQLEMTAYLEINDNDSTGHVG